jgi:hypothetical protein
MKIGLVGPSYQQRSLPFDAQRTINFVPVFDDQGKEVAALYGTPGLALFSTAGTGPIRNGFNSAKGRAFFVSGSTLYEIDASGTATVRGTLNTSSGNLTIDENSTQLFICDGDDGYTLTYSTNDFAQVPSVNFPTAGTVTFIDGYFVVNSVETGRFYISALSDGQTWAALDFATAEGSPDVLKRVLRALGQLWLFGAKTTEIWTNTGDASFPFQKIAGADMEVGIMAAHTAVAMANSVYFVGQNDQGNGIVCRAKGFTPERISTEAIELIIARATDKENIKGFSYQMDGHDYYVLTGGGLETSLAYDLTTNLWHERAFLEDDGSFSTHLASCVIFAFGQHLAGSREDGSIYTLSMDVFDDNGNEIARERIFTHLSNEGERIRYNSLEICFETGVGLQSGQGSDPVATIYLSKDGGRTWSDGYVVSIGAVGEYKKKVRVRRIGIAEQLTIKVRITDPVKVAITGSYLV